MSDVSDILCTKTIVLLWETGSSAVSCGYHCIACESAQEQRLDCRIVAMPEILLLLLLFCRYLAYVVCWHTGLMCWLGVLR